jgi:osmotically-inducible protein OsmY
MSISRYVGVAVLSVVVGPASMIAAAPQASQTERTEPDNTKVNKRDRSSSEPTADQAGQNASDREIMQKIRKAMVGDDSLSTNAKNVKVIAENGKVTLKGPVNTDAEKRSIEAKAVEVAGAGNVVNKITVKGDKSSAKATSDKP